MYNYVCSPAVEKDSLSADDFFTGQGSPAAVHRLLAGIWVHP